MSGEQRTIEQEVERRIALACQRLHELLDESNEKLRKAELRAAIAEWAIAGVLSRNLHVSCTYEDAQAKDREQMARFIGRNAAANFLHSAELQFQAHAEHAELKARMHASMPYIHVSTDRKFETERNLWPRP